MATWLYHKAHPKGHVFHSDADVKKAYDDGWVDAPGKWDQPVKEAHAPEGLERPRRKRNHDQRNR